MMLRVFGWMKFRLPRIKSWLPCGRKESVFWNNQTWGGDSIQDDGVIDQCSSAIRSRVATQIKSRTI
jgi:hypothetical protein